MLKSIEFLEAAHVRTLPARKQLVFQGLEKQSDVRIPVVDEEEPL